MGASGQAQLNRFVYAGERSPAVRPYCAPHGMDPVGGNLITAVITHLPLIPTFSRLNASPPGLAGSGITWSWTGQNPRSPRGATQNYAEHAYSGACASVAPDAGAAGTYITTCRRRGGETERADWAWTPCDQRMTRLCPTTPAAQTVNWHWLKSIFNARRLHAHPRVETDWTVFYISGRIYQPAPLSVGTFHFGPRSVNFGDQDVGGPTPDELPIVERWRPAEKPGHAGPDPPAKLSDYPLERVDLETSPAFPRPNARHAARRLPVGVIRAAARTRWRARP